MRAAVREVRSGRTVSLAAPVNTRPGPDDPDPAEHRLTAPAGAEPAERGLEFARDRFAMNIHGDVKSHLDALCHVIYDGTLHGGAPAADALSPAGASALSVDLIRDGIVGRGVLLDVPRLHGVPWLEPGTSMTAKDLAAAEVRQEVRVGRGDIVLVRVGHRRRREELGPWDVSPLSGCRRPPAPRSTPSRSCDGRRQTADGRRAIARRPTIQAVSWWTLCPPDGDCPVLWSSSHVRSRTRPEAPETPPPPSSPVRHSRARAAGIVGRPGRHSGEAVTPRA
ncbi:cyclase family protein [Streptomyces sp. NPDC003015]